MTAMASSSCCCNFNINILPSLRSPSLISPSAPPSFSSSSSFSSSVAAAAAFLGSSKLTKFPHPKSSSSVSPSSCRLLPCKAAAAEYVFPDPIPEFAEAETNKFRTHLLEKLSKKKKDLFGDSIEEVVRVCSEILNNFLHAEYGGPGTLLVIPFIDMADTLNERGLPGGPQAARAAVVWAQKNIDKDWNEWIKGEDKQDSKIEL